MQKYQNNIADRSGNAVAGLTVTVTLQAGGGLATIYSDNAGSVAANPLTTDSNGYFEFYAADGRYNIDAPGGGYHDVLIADTVLIAGAAAASASAAQGSATSAASDKIAAETAASLAVPAAATATSQATIATTQAGLSAAAQSAAAASALSAQGYANAAVAGSNTYTTTAQGITATTSGQTFFVRTVDPLTFLVYLNNAGVAQFLYPVTFASVSAVNTAVTAMNANVAAYITVGVLPIGWIEPNDWANVSYRNDYGVKFYSDGARVYPMLLDSSAKPEWRRGGLRVRNPVDGLYYVSVSMARRYDPTLQGVGYQSRYVDNINGNDTTGDGLTWATAFRTVEKVEAALNADGVNNIYVCFVRTSTFIGGNSAGWNNATHNLNANKQLKVVGVGESKPWWLPGMRNSYTKATFAWVSMGNGIWKTTAVALNVNARRTKVVFDLSVLDANGMPTPSEYLAGPHADEAAILAAMADKPTFHTTAADALYVKLASGAEPDPGINYAYNELGVANIFAIEEGGRLMIENIRACHNAGTASNSTLFAFRPKTYTQGSSAPNVQHDNRVVLKDCEIYGSSGNGYSFLSIQRAIVEDCKDGFCWLDGVNTHSLYSYPANSNSTNEGMYQHTWVDGHMSLYHGPNGFGGQPAENMSSNCYTDHERGRGTVINARGGFSNGSAFAIVGGGKYLALNTNIFLPRYVAPATDTYQACYLASGVAAGVPADGSEIWLLNGTGNAPRGNVPVGVVTQGVMFYASNNARVVAADFRGRKTKFTSGTGAVLDGDGNPI
jgi:hypothetical protein